MYRFIYFILYASKCDDLATLLGVTYAPGGLRRAFVHFPPQSGSTYGISKSACYALGN